jgi:hypothetical protein
MCKEMPVIPIHRVVYKKRIIGKIGRAEERHMGSQSPHPPPELGFRVRSYT